VPPGRLSDEGARNNAALVAPSIGIWHAAAI
jgi:hypothetical protein